MEACQDDRNCVGVALNGNACYKKSSIGTPTPVSGIFAARITAYPPPDPTSPATVSHFNYLACYNDPLPNHTLSDAFLYGDSSNGMTLDRCANFCGTYAYFGVENANECYCGNVMQDSPEETDPGDCDTACGGDNTELCGGDGTINIYQSTNSTTKAKARR